MTERKQEVKGVKGARKDAKIGRIRREEREREQEKAFSKKANIHRRRATSEGNTKSSRKQTKKRSSRKRNEPQRIRERRGGKLSRSWVFFFFALRPGNSSLLYQLSIDTSFSSSSKSRFSKILAFISSKPSRRFIAQRTF